MTMRAMMLAGPLVLGDGTATQEINRDKVDQTKIDAAVAGVLAKFPPPPPGSE